ncbi:RagB/SusD family nutrient uptake outer membrane protein [Litoribacter alkaliphilus]|uniref:RagB/SusD family nutrient uptake outer membrane protein n=1 Tax=Litoribacter ruber TaxID=702568 RepID=A0AAP2CKW1_9BACT|nr:RagB/SusD family nutrient uptake outer membrane protein [Litoribacter alkaliphilus]MBS9525639.1 RagB/SusD family nutrient uptake outer membrane protein [Litoribacter alkaliphilus]
MTELDLAPLDATSELTYWETEEDARIFLNSMYADLMSADSYLFLNSASDDAYSRAREDYRNIGNGNYDSSNGLIAGTWASRFEGLRRANIFLNNIHKVESMDDGLKETYIGQARFIRAWHYFYLREFFGDVPLVTEEISIDESLVLTRTDQSTILAFIYDELDLAINVLQNNISPEQQGRISQNAAIAFKSRIHLYNQEYEEAAMLASQLIGEYQLFPSYEGLFKPDNQDNTESLLSLQFVPTDREHNIQYSLIPPSLSGYSNFAPLQELVDSYTMINGMSIQDPSSDYNENDPFNNRDPRLAASIIYDNYELIDFNGNPVTIRTAPGFAPDGLNYSSNSTPSGYYVSKFFDRGARNNTNSGLNLMVIRYAEVLLNYAEAKIELGTFNEQDWVISIGAIRERAGLNGAAIQYPGNNQEILRSIVRNERRIELAFEAGHRFFDIRRWRIAEEVLDGWAHGMKTNNSTQSDGYERVDLRSFNTGRHYLWPVPLREIELNNNLTQNPNW